jgi:hypothetical protein
MDRALGTEGIDVAEFLVEDVSVEEKDGVKGPGSAETSYLRARPVRFDCLGCVHIYS